MTSLIKHTDKILQLFVIIENDGFFPTFPQKLYFLILFLPNQTLLTGEMPEIFNGEKCEMKLLKMQMKKCPKIPRMPYMLS